VTKCWRHVYIVTALAWQRDGKRFRRFVIRFCPECQEKDVTELFYVEPDYPLCYAGLSQLVELVSQESEQLQYRCRDCKAVTWVDEDL